MSDTPHITDVFRLPNVEPHMTIRQHDHNRWRVSITLDFYATTEVAQELLEAADPYLLGVEASLLDVEEQL